MTIFSLKKLICIILCMMIISSLNFVHINAEEYETIGFSTLYSFGDSLNQETKIGVQNIDKENYIILPSTASPQKIILCGDFTSTSVFVSGAKGTMKRFVSGMEINLDDYCNNGEYYLDFTLGRRTDRGKFTVNFLFSENISAVYLKSDDPILEGRNWVEESPDKSNKAKGTMVMQKSDGEIVYSGALTQIKGRGNTTWGLPKKPYQIKTAEKVDLLQTNNPDNETKTWILLANYFDPALIRNSLALNMGKVLGMESNIEHTYVDLYYDGEYRGNYMLTEKVEVDSGRVAIEDLEGSNEEVNPDKKMDDFPVQTATAPCGATYTYCEGMVSPDDIRGGYLLEMDYEVRALEEVCYFKTTRNQYVVVKSPEYASKEEMEYIATLYQEYEDAVFNGGINEKTGKSFSDYVDVKNVASYYLVNEFSKSSDFFSSSAYLYKSANEDIMHMGPLWDYDLSFGKNHYRNLQSENPYGLSPYNTEFSKKLIEIDEFYEVLKTIYYEVMSPMMKSFIADGGEGGDKTFALNPLSNMVELLNATGNNNVKLWHNTTTFQEEVDSLRNFISLRLVALDEIMGDSFESKLRDNQFWDVFSDSWFYYDVTKACELGYMEGYGDGFFEPYANVTRAQTAQIIYNMASPGEYEIKFSCADIPENEWYTRAVLWATNEYVMDVFSDGCFCPNEFVTREDFAYFLYRYIGKPKVNEIHLMSAGDAFQISPHKAEALNWAVSKGILNGDTDGMLNPKGHLTRAEMAAILLRFNEGK